MTFFVIKKTDYTPTTFCITEDGSIYAYNREIGFMKNHISLDKLKSHVGQLVTEGFTVTEPRAADRLRLIEFINKH